MRRLTSVLLALSCFGIAQNVGTGGISSAGVGGSFTPPVVVTQSANGATVETFKRFTDTSPTGFFDLFTSQDSLTTLFSVDVSGNVSAAGSLSVNAASNPCGSSSPCIGGAEGATAPTPSAGNDFIHFNATNHCIEASQNGSTLECVPLILGDTTTFNVSTTKHGYAPKAPNDATKYLDGTGAYSVPAGGATINATNNVIPKRQSATAFIDSSLTDDGTTLTTSDNLAFSAGFPTIGGITNGHIVFRFGAVNRVSVRDDTNTFQPETDNQTDLGTSGARWKNGYFAGIVQSPAFISPNSVHFTGQTATKTIYTLCAAAAGGCNTAGQYRIAWYFNQGGTACGTPGTGGVTFALTWVDNAGTHSAVALPMDDASSLTATGTKFTFQSSNTAAWASGIFNIWSTGASDIQITNTYTACSVGTGNWELAASAERLQ